jgi:ribosomal protein S6
MKTTIAGIAVLRFGGAGAFACQLILSLLLSGAALAQDTEANTFRGMVRLDRAPVSKVDKDGKVTFEYTIDKNSEIAKNLKGHLMLITGDIDNHCCPKQARI